MNTYTIFADLHIGAGNYEWPGNLEYGENVVYLGDCWEFKNIAKKDYHEYLELWMKHIAKSKKTGTVVVAGNHEVKIGHFYGKYDYVNNGILFTHGHRAVYSNKKIDKWELREPGLGWFMLSLMRIKRRKYSLSKWKEPSGGVKKKLVSYARDRGFNKIVVGHFHQNWRGVYDNVEIVLCGRGRTEIEI